MDKLLNILAHILSFIYFLLQSNLFQTWLIRNPFILLSLGANSIILKPNYFELFFMSRGTSKYWGLTVLLLFSLIEEAWQNTAHLVKIYSAILQTKTFREIINL